MHGIETWATPLTRFATVSGSFKLSAVTGRLDSINVSRGGTPKSPIMETLATENGLDGDRQRDLRVHGGLDRAAVLYSLEVIKALQAEGHPIAIGSTGENLTIAGLSWDRLGPGATLRIGDVRLLITSYATPCSTIRGSFIDGRFERIGQKHHPGWSRLCARVLSAGLLRVGDLVLVESASAAIASATAGL